MSSADLVQRVYQHFGVEPLQPEQSELYVDLDEARGSTGDVSRLENTIRRSGATFTCQVLAGHRGSGKSTELLRLKQRLETGKDAFFVV